MIELRTDPSQKELAWFGLLLLGFFALVGGIVWRATETITAARYVWITGVLLAATYYAVPPVRRSMFVGWMYAAYPIGWVVSHVLLALIYFGVLTPIGLLLRAARYDPMNRRVDRHRPTYWIARDGNTPASRYFRQF